MQPARNLTARKVSMYLKIERVMPRPQNLALLIDSHPVIKAFIAYKAQGKRRM